MHSHKSSQDNQIKSQDNLLVYIEITNVFDQESNKTLHQIIEDTVIHHFTSGIDNQPVARYTSINSR